MASSRPTQRANVVALLHNSHNSCMTVSGCPLIGPLIMKYFFDCDNSSARSEITDGLNADYITSTVIIPHTEVGLSGF